MSNEFGFDFENNPSLDTVFEPSGYAFLPFYEFHWRLRSLQRFFYFTSQFIGYYLHDFQRFLEQLTDPAYITLKEEEYDALSGGEIGYDAMAHHMQHAELFSVDNDSFPETLRGSIISHLFALIETLLTEVADDIAKSLGQDPVALPDKPMPYINRYITYLERGCGLSLNISKATWKEIDVAREVRNRYIHSISRGFPEQIQIELQEITESGGGAGNQVNDEFVSGVFSTIGSIAQQLEDAYWSFQDSTRSSNS